MGCPGDVGGRRPRDVLGTNICRLGSFSLSACVCNSFNYLYNFGVFNLFVLHLTIFSLRRSEISGVGWDMLGRFLVDIACNLKDFLPVSIT